LKRKLATTTPVNVVSSGGMLLMAK